MDEVHLVDTNSMDWSPHPVIPAVLTKLVEDKTTYENASVILVNVKVGGVIPEHVHDIETETAYIISGEGMLTVGNGERRLASGMSVTIPSGLPHSLRNVGDEPMEILGIHIPPAY